MLKSVYQIAVILPFILHVQMKQETKKLMDYESALLLSYKTYLEYLEHTIKGAVLIVVFVTSLLKVRGSTSDG